MNIVAPYVPLEWHVKPWFDKSPIVLLTGSAGGGKSRLAGEKIHYFMLAHPNATGLILRKAREYCTKSVVPFMEKTVIGDDTSHVQIHRSDSYWQYWNGSMLFWGGMKDDGQREALRSIGSGGALDIVWMEEANAFTEDDFNEILARMRGTAAAYNQIILSTNPDHPAHWIRQRLILKNEAAVYYSSNKDNRHNPAHYADTLNKLTGVLRQRLVEGKWIQAEGAVYDEYDETVHLVDSFPVPPNWVRYRAIDFGFANPFTCLWAAENEDGDLFVYREIYHTRRRVDQHAAQINELSQGEYFVDNISDHDAEDRATLEHLGIKTRAAQKDVSPGIQAVKQRLHQKRLFIMRGCLVEEDPELKKAGKPTSIVEEFPAYVWHKSKDGQPVKEAPVKENDHALDALRYLVMRVDNRKTRKGYLGRI